MPRKPKVNKEPKVTTGDTVVTLGVASIEHVDIVPKAKPKKKTLEDVMKQNTKPVKKAKKVNKYNIKDLVFCKTMMNNQLTIHSVKETNGLYTYRCYDYSGTTYYILEELLIKL